MKRKKIERTIYNAIALGLKNGQGIDWIAEQAEEIKKEYALSIIGEDEDITSKIIESTHANERLRDDLLSAQASRNQLRKELREKVRGK